MRCLSAFLGYGWAYGFALTPLPPQTIPQFCESCLKPYLMQVCKWCHYNLVEAVEPFKLRPSSMSYIHNVFECLYRFWMGIWLFTHPVTTTAASPDLGKLAEILPDASVQTMPLCFDWDCRTFQTASHVHAIHIWGVWAPSQVAWLGNLFGIPQNSAINPIPGLLNSGIFIGILFSDRKMCSRQFWTHFFRFRILSRHLFFQFH